MCKAMFNYSKVSVIQIFQPVQEHGEPLWNNVFETSGLADFAELAIAIWSEAVGAKKWAQPKQYSSELALPLCSENWLYQTAT